MLGRALLHAGPRLRDAAVKADLLRSVGPRNAWRHRRAAAAERSDDQSRADRVYGTIWRDAAAELGAEVAELPGGFLELRAGGEAARVWRHMTPLDDVVTLRLARDKPVVHQLLGRRELPVPAHVVAGRGGWQEAVAFLRAAGGPCVVKPASGAYGGLGATGQVETEKQLARAVLRASRSGGEALVERQLEGAVYRLLLLDGELLDVVGRRPPVVTGDGRSTIGELIAAENRRRLDSHGELGARLLGLDLDLLFTLRKQGLRLGSVPGEGVPATIKTVTNQNAPADNRTIAEPPSPALVTDARRAAAEVGVTLAGVDVITTDPGAPLRETGGAIIEVNACPGLHHHYHVADPAGATRVAVPVLRRLLASGEGG